MAQSNAHIQSIIIRRRDTREKENKRKVINGLRPPRTAKLVDESIKVVCVIFFLRLKFSITHVTKTSFVTLCYVRRIFGRNSRKIFKKETRILIQSILDHSVLEKFEKKKKKAKIAVHLPAYIRCQLE